MKDLDQLGLHLNPENIISSKTENIYHEKFCKKKKIGIVLSQCSIYLNVQKLSRIKQKIYEKG